jgi:cytochrome c
MATPNNNKYIFTPQKVQIKRYSQAVLLQCNSANINQPARKCMMRTLISCALSATALLSTAPAFADMALATSKNCMACHAVDKKIVGPSYKDIAAKYKGDKTAVDKLAAKIIKGGSGAWGAVPMPANPQVNEADAKKLATWILSQK